MRGDVLVDLRNMFRTDAATRRGLRYTSIGRPLKSGGDGKITHGGNG